MKLEKNQISTTVIDTENVPDKVNQINSRYDNLKVNAYSPTWLLYAFVKYFQK